MVKTTVRFEAAVVDRIESLVEDGVFESKSEFSRFASEYVLDQLDEEYDPHMVDFDAVKAEVIPDDPHRIETGPAPRGTGIPFFESLAMIRKYALRGNLSDAEDFIDHHYEPNEPDALVLEEFLELYRTSSRVPDSQG